MTTANTNASPSRTKASVGPAYAWGILLFCAFTFLVIVWFKFLGSEQKYDDKRAITRAEKLKALRAEEHKTLSNYAWGNKEKGIAHLPIARAMELVAADLKNSTVAPSEVKVENPYPAGLAPQPAPAPEATK